MLALCAAAALYARVTDVHSVGPVWLVAALAGLLVAGIWLAWYRDVPHLGRRAALVFLTGITGAIAGSVTLLVGALLTQGPSAPMLLADAALLWSANVATFAVWYWELDAGGPHQRSGSWRAWTRPPDFLFPQMTLDDQVHPHAAQWSPHFVDYLFVAFNTSTAFSPTDVPVLSRRAKLLSMTQASISLVAIAVLAARAVNALQNG